MLTCFYLWGLLERSDRRIAASPHRRIAASPHRRPGVGSIAVAALYLARVGGLDTLG